MAPADDQENQQDLVFSYLALRKTIGLLGLSLPFVVSLGALLFFGTGMQDSISSYYHTGTRDAFVGILFAVGFFLFSYRGYERKDDVAGNLACVFALGTALFPTAPPGSTAATATVVGSLHLVFAGLFLLTLSYFCLVLFTKTDKTSPGTPKLLRNRVYRVCGYTMLGCLALILIYKVAVGSTHTAIAPIQPIFWLEALAIFAFGVSWFVKGEAILKDE